MSALSSISPTDLSILVNVVAIALAEGRTPDDLNVIGNSIVGIGSLLLTIAAQQQFLISEKDKIKQIKDLKSQIAQNEKDLKNLITEN